MAERDYPTTIKTVESPFDTAGRAMRQAEAFVDRAKALADRLCGSVPEPVSDNQRVGPSGALHQLDATASRLFNALVDGDAALARIEALLPAQEPEMKYVGAARG